MEVRRRNAREWHVCPDRLPIDDPDGQMAFWASLDNTHDARSGRELSTSGEDVRVFQCGALRLGVLVSSLKSWLSEWQTAQRYMQQAIQAEMTQVDILERKYISHVHLNGSSEVKMEEEDRFVPMMDEEGVEVPRPAEELLVLDLIRPGEPHPSDPIIPRPGVMDRMERQMMLKSLQQYRRDTIQRQVTKLVESQWMDFRRLPVHHIELNPIFVKDVPRLISQLQLK